MDAIFRRDGRPIIWPEPTHSKNGVGGKQKWVPVANVLDFSDLGQSIFTRKKPLAEKTMIRTANGIKKFVMDNPNPFFLSERQAYPFLIQYHSETCGGVRGQNITEPVMTLDTSNRYGLVSVFVEKFYKTGTGQDANEPLHTITTSPGHFGLVSVFLTKYYGSGCGQPANDPLGTITTKDRFGMTSVIISGEPMRIVDIRLRMLKPEELKLAQGFPADYIINRDYMWKTYPKSEQVKRIGNSVVPIMAEALVRANCGYLKVGERKPAPIIYQQQNGQVAFG